jgi:peptide/nickel transport system permease protein
MGSAKLYIGALTFGLVLVLALFGDFITAHDAQTQDLLFALQPPDLSSEFLFGTDQLGRDVFARMVSGARVSLLIAGSVVLTSGVFGVLVGALSGYWGGVRDTIAQKIVETFWAIPPLLLALVILAFLGQSLLNVILALSIQRWIPYTRLARAQTIVLRSRDFVAAAQSMGAGTAWTLRKHLLPNLYSSAVVVGTFTMATAILAEASLSFLGVGVPAEIATWGGMLAEGRTYVLEAWWIAVFPGLGIFVTVLGLNLLGDWMRDIYDPKNHLNVR